MLLVVCQLSHDVIGLKIRNVIGEFQSIFCLSLTVFYGSFNSQVKFNSFFLEFLKKKTNKQTGPSKSADKEVSFEWSHYRILSTDLVSS